MSLMGSLYVGTSGLKTSQNALNTTAHNMANMDNIGYTRQQVQQGTRFYNTISVSASAVSYQQVGLGVTYSQTKQVRDDLLDKLYRRELGRSGYYGVSSNATEEVENIFGELEGKTFGSSLENLWKSVQDLVRDPMNPTDQSVFVQRCSEFLNKANLVYDSLAEYQNDLNYKVKQQVDKINSYGKRINELNQEIVKIESGNVEHANDLRDERNKLIDELSAIADITCTTDPFGNVLVALEGNSFVKAESVNTIGLYSDPQTGFYTPYWEQLATYTTNPDGSRVVDSIANAKVYDLTQKISQDTNMGSLKALLIARGDHHATYDDMLNSNYYNSNIKDSVIMNVQAQFDQLIYKVTSSINKVLEDAANAAGAFPGSQYMRDEHGNPLQMFDLSNTNPPGNYTIKNITMNSTLKNAPSLLGFKLPNSDDADMDTVNKLEAIFSDKVHTLNPNVETKTNLGNYYNDLVIQVANTGSAMRSFYENQQSTVNAVSSAREQILGVSSDEEMSFMVMYQNAYNASSRYINVISEMLEHVVSTLGR